MASVPHVGSEAGDRGLRTALPWLILAAGWSFMYGPLYVELARTLWTTDEHFHEALILLIDAWLIWNARKSVASARNAPEPWLGGAVFLFGALVYVAGRLIGIWFFSVGSQIPVLAGIVLAAAGRRALRALWFPLAFLLFMIPLPNILVDAVTGPLKNSVSAIAESVLYAFGYPIGRSGVRLTVGPYDLLVADACSGLHSMFSLSALGVLFVFLMRRTRWQHVLIMLASILPFAYAANILRVITLILVTYHFGDEVGQGFLHEFDGLLMFLVALFLLIGLDAVLAKLFPDAKAAG
jgi:exosortase B